VDQYSNPRAETTGQSGTHPGSEAQVDNAAASLLEYLHFLPVTLPATLLVDHLVGWISDRGLVAVIYLLGDPGLSPEQLVSMYDFSENSAKEAVDAIARHQITRATEASLPKPSLTGPIAQEFSAWIADEFQARFGQELPDVSTRTITRFAEGDRQRVVDVLDITQHAHESTTPVQSFPAYVVTLLKQDAAAIHDQAERYRAALTANAESLRHR